MESCVARIVLACRGVRPVLLAAVVFLLTQPRGQGQTPPAFDFAAVPDDRLAATIDGEPITAKDVRAIMKLALAGQEIPDAAPIDVAPALDAAIDQRLVRGYVITSTSGAKPEEIDAMIERLKASLEQQQSSLERFQQQRGLSDEQLRSQIEWELSWAKYSARAITDASLAAYFERHRRQFDGTQLRVSHVLLRVDEPLSPDAVAAAVAQARDIRQEVLDAKLSFANAARKYSDGPSRRVGGDLGMIARDGPMVEAFNKAAFALRAGEISEPVVTPFGVHVIQVTDEKPGEKTWSDSAAQIKKLVTDEVIEEIARQQRETLKVEYRDDFPHFQPGTKTLAPPWGPLLPESTSEEQAKP